MLSEKKGIRASRRGAKKTAASFIPVLLILGMSIFFTNNLFSKDKVRKRQDLNVLLITIDTIRADRVGYSGYDIETPNLDSLAYGGTRFTNAVCQVPLTLPSHASILTGTNPTYHQIKGNGPYYLSDDFTTLAEIMRTQDYLTSAFVGAYVLDSQYGLSQGFDDYDDEFITPDYSVKERTAEEVYNSAARWLEKYHDQKFFVWVHYFDPHDPYTPPPPFDMRYETRPYEGEIAYTDVYVGKLIRLLEERKIYHKTLIIVVGDHGEDLLDHGEHTHGIFLYDTTLKVPLILHAPEIIPRGVVIDKQARTIDIFPTILDILKIDIPKFCQGVSLVPLVEGKRIKKIEESYAETYHPLLSYGWSDLRSIRTNEWKYILAPKPELYDLKNDPLEKENLIGSKNKIASDLNNKLKKLEKATTSEQKPSIRELTPEEQEKLRALGYSAETLPSDIGQKRRPDPKDRIFILDQLYKFKMAKKEGKQEEGEKILREIVKQDPENLVVHHFLGKIYQDRKEWDKAIEEYSEILRINPDGIDSYYMLAKCYYGKGVIDEAIKASEAALTLHPKHLKSLLFLVSLNKSLGKTDEMLHYLERAVYAVPSKWTMRLEYAQALVSAKKFEKAIKEYEILREKMPDNPMIYNNLGIIYYSKNDYEQAVKYLSKEVELHSNPNSYLLLGLSYGNLEKYAEAVLFLEKFLNQSSVRDVSLRKRAEQALAFFRSKIK